MSLGFDLNPIMAVVARARLLPPSEADNIPPFARGSVNGRIASQSVTVPQKRYFRRAAGPGYPFRSTPATPFQPAAAQPKLERFVAKCMGATTYEAGTSPVPILSNPGRVTDVIRAAAKATTSSQRLA